VLLILLLLWILLGPVIIFLDTDNHRYLVVLPGVFKAAVVPSKDLFHIRVWIFFIPYSFNPFRVRRKKGGKEKPVKKKKPKKISGSIKMGIDAVRCFRIRKLFLDMDTDDFMLNAWLIPAFSFVNSGNIQMRTNFTGNFSLLLDMRTRIGTLLWVFIKYRIKSFF